MHDLLGFGVPSAKLLSGGTGSARDLFSKLTLGPYSFAATCNWGIELRQLLFNEGIAALNGKIPNTEHIDNNGTDKGAQHLKENCVHTQAP
jgi:hypothetical protein